MHTLGVVIVLLEVVYVVLSSNLGHAELFSLFFSPTLFQRPDFIQRPELFFEHPNIFFWSSTFQQKYFYISSCAKKFFYSFPFSSMYPVGNMMIFSLLSVTNLFKHQSNLGPIVTN